MDGKIITYKNRLEIKIISIFYTIIFGGLFIYVLISDVVSHNEFIFENLLKLLLGFSPFLVILWIIARYKIVFDFNKKEIKYVHYFKIKHIYKFSDIKSSMVRGKTTLPNDYTFNFISDNKVVFKISSIDFEGQTHESSDYLKEFFTGDAQFIYELEKEIKKTGINVSIYYYELIDAIGALYYANKNNRICFGYSSNFNNFIITVCEDLWDNNFVPKSNLIENINVEKENLLSLLVQYYEKYK